MRVNKTKRVVRGELAGSQQVSSPQPTQPANGIKENIRKPTFRDGFFLLLGTYLGEHGIALSSAFKLLGGTG